MAWFYEGQLHPHLNWKQERKTGEAVDYLSLFQLQIVALHDSDGM